MLRQQVEYAESIASLIFVIDKVLPLVRAKVDLVDEQAQPGIHGLLGASLGGLMALWGGLRYPQYFGHVLSQAGAFMPEWAGEETGGFNLIRQNPTRPIKIWQDVGAFDTLLAGNRLMNNLLKEKGYKPGYSEYSGGHNYVMWANQVGEGLKYLYGPPV